MGELIDLVDKNGSVVRTGVTRDDAKRHPEGHMQIIIAVIRNKAGQFLVHKRSMQKSVNPGDIDHVCGGINSGEAPIDAAHREAAEEGGVALTNATIVRQGLNQYERFCHLLEATTNDEPDHSKLDPAEVEWAKFFSLDELKAKRDSGELTFVDGFFEDIEHVLEQKVAA